LWRVSLCGPLTAYHEPSGLELRRFRTHKTASLLGFLARFPTPHLRDGLAHRLWPEASPTSARHNLRMALSALRKSGLPVSGDRQFVFLIKDQIQTDLHDLESAIVQENYPQILELYTRPFLQGLEDDWIVMERQRFERHYLIALRHEAQEPGSLLKLRPVLENLPFLSSDREELHALWLRLLLAEGRPEAAKNYYENLRRRRRRAGEPVPTALRRLLTPDPRYVSPDGDVPDTGLIGREQELAEVLMLLEKHRLVTLIGPGGIGKTSLAHAVRRHKSGLFLTLTALSAAQVRPALYDLLESNEAVSLGVAARRFGLVFIVFDSTEHLLPEVLPLLSELLTTCPTLRILVTSRSPLRLSQEQRFVLGPLSDSASKALFCELARRLAPHFVALESHGLLSQVLVALGGLPLALKLAAAQLDHLSLSELAASLGSLALESPHHDTPRRHRSLEEVIRSSEATLSPAARRLFAQLSVFHGGFTLAAAQAIAPDASALNEVIRASLLTPLPGRWSVLEPLRAVAMRRLTEAERSPLSDRHAHYFLAQVRACAGQFDMNPEWGRQLLPERGNIRVALEHLLQTDSQAALEFIVCLKGFWQSLATPAETLRFLTAALDDSATDDPGFLSLRCRAHSLAGTTLRQMRHLDEAERQYQEAQAIAERLDEAPLLGAVLFNRSWLAGDRDELAAALALCVAAQRQFERSGNLRGLRACAAQRYKIALAEGHFAEALPPLRERLLWLQQNGEPYVEELTDLGYVLLGQGQLAEAHATLERALTLAQAWPRPDGLLMPLLGCQTLVLLREGALDAARSPLIQLLQLQRSCDGDVKLWYFLTIAARWFAQAQQPHLAAACLGWAQGHLEDTHQAALRRALGVEEELRSALSALSTQELLAEKLRGRLCDPHTLLETLLEALTSH